MAKILNYLMINIVIKRIKQLISRVLFLLPFSKQGDKIIPIIIYLVVELLPISSDFSKLGGHLKRLIYLAFSRGLPGRYFSTPPVSSYLTFAPSPVIFQSIGSLLGINTPFCGPIHQLTLSGVSPATCPRMHGLSSPLARLSDCFIHN